jgi:sodium/proline symporter
MTPILLSFFGTMVLFVLVGLWSMRRSRHTSHDYLTASRSVSPSLAGLSAVATNNSGYMFVGMIGYTYVAGLSSIWLMIGWIVGDLMASLSVHRPVRLMAQRRHAHSFSSLIAHWQGEERLLLRRVAGLFTLLFLTVYAAAQLGAGSKALESVLGWDPVTGTVIGAAVILFYSFSGGLRASIWTDALQSVVMILSMGMLLFVTLESLGGVTAAWEALQQVKPGYMQWFPETHAGNWLEIGGFVVGWLFGGIGVIGQPHIMIRYMALDDVRSLNRMRLYYYSWFFLFYGATIGVGLLARVVVEPTAGFDPERALLALSQQSLPPFLVGVMLAGLFAATVSTADSLVLSCSAALTRDFTQHPLDTYKIAKFGTLAVTLSALVIALTNSKTVFALVLDAWGVFASAFGPLLFLLASGRKIGEKSAVALLLTGAATFYLWSLYGWSTLYAIAPAWAVSLGLYSLLRFRGKHTL